MSILLEEKERVSRNLLNQVIAFDQLIDEAETTDDKEHARALFLKQTKILNRLESRIDYLLNIGSTQARARSSRP